MRGATGRQCRRLMLIGLLLWGLGPAAAGFGGQNGLLEAGFAPEEAPVGGMVELILCYRLPQGAKLPVTPRIEGIEDLSVEGVQEGSGEIRIRILVDRLGQFETGPLSLAYVSAEGMTEWLRAEPASLAVLSNLGERPQEAQLKPICTIIPTRSRLFKTLPWVLAGLAVCAAGLGLFFWMKRNWPRPGASQALVLPHVVAEREIQELLSDRLFEKGHEKEFYFRLSEILRRYLEALRGFPAAEYTTQEIGLAIRAPEDRKLLALLEEADLVKFADLCPPPAKKGDQAGQALQYIRETRSVFEGEHASQGVRPSDREAGRGP